MQSFARQQALSGAGFDTNCADGICVVRPLGVVAEWSMWLQSTVPGQVSWPANRRPQAPTLARANCRGGPQAPPRPPADQPTHTLCDELNGSSEHLPRVADELPEVRVPAAPYCSSAVANWPKRSSPFRLGIHRDFYPDQVLIDGDRLFVVDHDLFAPGDPRLTSATFAATSSNEACESADHPHLYDDGAPR